MGADKRWGGGGSLLADAHIGKASVVVVVLLRQ